IIILILTGEDKKRSIMITQRRRMGALLLIGLALVVTGSHRSHTWKHPGERRSQEDDVNQLIRMAKLDALASGSTFDSDDLEARMPKRIPKSKPTPLARASKDGSMLYVDCDVDGQALKAFVDTGAQVTCMSAECAQRCGLMTKLDRRFAGRAVGVGSARILGRIHDANVRLGNTYVSCSFTVIDHSEIDVLVGLDVLRKYKCEISLGDNSMHFN
ncbi:unnamed protein product, partial [Chrysoparadoxa australica]